MARQEHVMRSVLRFVAEFTLAMAALFAGLGCLWAVSKIAPPVLMFLAKVGV